MPTRDAQFFPTNTQSDIWVYMPGFGVILKTEQREEVLIGVIATYRHNRVTTDSRTTSV